MYDERVFFFFASSDFTESGVSCIILMKNIHVQEDVA